ncbi:MAG: hypothetical protein ACP5HM_16545 [Anaerolineae bacterium]
MTKQAEQIVNVLAEMTEEPQQIAPQAMASAQAVHAEIVPRLEERPTYADLWQDFQAQPQEQKPVLAGIVQVLIQTDPALKARLQALLQQYQAATQGAGRQVNTGGGAYVGGSVEVTHGDFVGRDKRTTTITGDGNVVGDHSSSTVIKQQGADAASIARAFADVYTAVQQQPDLPPQDKADVQAELEEVETELQKGEAANEGFIRRRLRNVQHMAPDIYDVVLATFANPVAGLGLVAKKIAEKMKADAA